jgi:uncharacterized membrane protein AbrB (regulator of aidB expression)
MEENKKDWKDKPLGLPSGSVRAIIALGMVLVASYMMLILAIDVPGWFQAIIAVIIGFYFGKKTT